MKNNLQTPESLDAFTKKIIQDELTGGAAEFVDGPPCLARLTKEKMTDNRERFLYNYSVFAKKKYPDNWEDKVKEAAREYFVYDSKWDDSKVEGKIRDWKKSKSDKGYTCSRPYRSSVFKTNVLQKKVWSLNKCTNIMANFIRFNKNRIQT